LAVTDGLTALSNHRQFQQMLEEALTALHEEDEPFSLILLDIDHFKKLNDAFGHQEGDDTLVAFAATLQGTSRGNELPARYGGEEFAIILRNCRKEDATQASERFRSAVIRGAWNTRDVTCSLGVATASDRTITSREIVAKADAALYYSKLNGRNQSNHYEEISSHLNAA
jgi:diguanylate cyclase